MKALFNQFLWGGAEGGREKIKAYDAQFKKKKPNTFYSYGLVGVNLVVFFTYQEHVKQRLRLTRYVCMLFLGTKNQADPDVIRTRSLLIWSQTRYHCATESTYGQGDEKVIVVLTSKHIADAWRLLLLDQTTDSKSCKILSMHICDPHRILQIFGFSILSSAAEASVLGSEEERKRMLMGRIALPLNPL